MGPCAPLMPLRPARPSSPLAPTGPGFASFAATSSFRYLTFFSSVERLPTCWPIILKLWCMELFQSFSAFLMLPSLSSSACSTFLMLSIMVFVAGSA